MGVVYLAEDLKLHRLVALKFLRPDATSDLHAKQRFMQEAQTASALDHPNICTIYAIDETPDGQLLLAMARYEGETLRDLLARGPLGIERALDIAMQTAHGLHKAHEAGIVHRDVKPANVMVTAEGGRGRSEGSGLRPGEAGRSRPDPGRRADAERGGPPEHAEPCGDDRGDAGIHVAGAGDGRQAGRAQRRVQLRSASG